jgi:sporulation-control protein
MSILTRFGIGSATIDLIPDETEVPPGGAVDAHLEVIGGQSSQTVDDIEIAVVTRYRAHREDDSYPTHHVLWETEFKEGFTVEPEMEDSLNVPPIQIPASTPVTMGNAEVWIQSGLDIDWAVDPSDEDQLEIQPPPKLQAILDAMDQLGFGLRSVQNEEADTRLTPAPFLQEFGFRGGSGDLAGKIDEVTLSPINTESNQQHLVLMEIDRIGERDIGDRRHDRLTVETENVDAVANQLRSAIERRL